MKVLVVDGRRTAAGVAAAAAGLGFAELAAVVGGQPSLVDGLGRAIVDVAPRPAVELAVKLLGDLDKPVIRAGVLAGVVAAGGVLGLVSGTRWRDALVAGGFSAAAAVALRRPPRRTAVAAVAGAGGAAVTGAALRLRDPVGVATAGVAGLAALAGARVVERARWSAHARRRAGLGLAPASPKPPAADGAERWAGVSPLLTPVEEFFVTDVNVGAPLIDPGRWRLRVRGLVEAPLELSLDELADLGLVEFDAVMVCIHSGIAGDRADNARWLGVPLHGLLDRAGLSHRADTLVSRAVDGFSISFPLDRVRSGDLDGYVVVGMNGEPLTPAHGFPARVFVPGLYGQYGGTKWLTELLLTAGPHPDYWVRKGWPKEPVPVRPHARIDTPADGARLGGDSTIGGVAWAPLHGIERVEVSVDGGPWRAAELAGELSLGSWRRWRLRVDLPQGWRRLEARAVPRVGPPQDARPRPPFPTGPSGLHAVRVRVLPRGSR